MKRGQKSVQELFSLSGKTAVVTGGAGHLGSAMCTGLAEAGARVVVASRNYERTAALASSLTGEGHMAVELDQADPASVKELFPKVFKLAEKVDILINNAWGNPQKEYGTFTPEDFTNAFQIGVTAYYQLAEALKDHLVERGASGIIVNTGSTYGVGSNYPRDYDGLQTESPPYYHAVKAGVINLTRFLAVNWAKYNIRVNTISPGPFPNRVNTDRIPGFEERLIHEVPLGRMGEPNEMKGVVVFLSSDASSYVTGQNLLVDGGWTAW